jgi:UDP-N-acetylglucosamine--N-acetylmuramyl-(pentapeptide) pyrophosphoryl-undecaprenol N-acetylglucosamine transferase
VTGVQTCALPIWLIWQTGRNDYDEARNTCLPYTPSAWVNMFIDRMDYAYAVADLVVCRAGATTIAEITRLGKPAVLIPYPHAAANHQLYNAMELVNAGAAKLLLDGEAVARFAEVVVPLLAGGGALSRMAEASKHLGKPHAARDIAKRIMMLAESQDRH